MQAKNPYSKQLNDLNLLLENDAIDAEDIVQNIFNVAKRDVMSALDEERKMLATFCLEVVEARLRDPLGQHSDPLLEIELMIAEYATARKTAMQSQRLEFDYTEALMQRAFKQASGEKLQ